MALLRCQSPRWADALSARAKALNRDNHTETVSNAMMASRRNGFTLSVNSVGDAQPTADRTDSESESMDPPRGQILFSTADENVPSAESGQVSARVATKEGHTRCLRAGQGVAEAAIDEEDDFESESDVDKDSIAHTYASETQIIVKIADSGASNTCAIDASHSGEPTAASEHGASDPDSDGLSSQPRARSDDRSSHCAHAGQQHPYSPRGRHPASSSKTDTPQCQSCACRLALSESHARLNNASVASGVLASGLETVVTECAGMRGAFSEVMASCRGLASHA